jgi:hypothetical protein
LDRERFDYTDAGKQAAAGGTGRPAGVGQPGGLGQPSAPSGVAPRKKSSALAGIVGCLGGLVFVALIVGGIGVFVWGIMQFMKSSDAYQQAMERAETHPGVIAVLGEPIEPAWYLTGSVNEGSGTGEAKLEIPLSGPIGDGTLYVQTKTIAGELRFDVLTLRVRGTDERINLLRE